MRSLILLGLALLLATPLGAQQVDWLDSLPDARLTAEREQRNLLVFVTAGAWCRPCGWMEDTVLSREAIVALIEEAYVPLKLHDYDDARLELPVEAFPSTLIYAPDGSLVENVRGPRSAQLFEAILVRNREPAAISGEPRRFVTERGSFVYVGEGSWERRVDGSAVTYLEYDRDEQFIYLETEEAPRFLALPPQGGAMWQWDPLTESWEEFATAQPE